MFKKFCYYYLFKKKNGSCRHEVGCRVAQKVQESGITSLRDLEVYKGNVGCQFLIFLIYTHWLYSYLGP